MPEKDHTNEIQVRFLTQADALKCTEMLTKFYRGVAVSHDVPILHIENTIQTALAGSPYVKIITCSVGDAFAGLCTLSFSFSTEAGGTVVLMEELYVREDFQGQGLANAMFRFIREQFDGQVKRYRLEAVEENHGAIKLYTRWGFQPLAYKQMILDL